MKWTPPSDPVDPEVAGLRVIESTPAYHDAMLNLFINGLKSQVPKLSPGVGPFIDYLISNGKTEFRDPGQIVSENTGGRFLLAVTPDSDELIGMIGLARFEHHITEREVEFTRISVHSDWRRRGIGTLLLNRAVHTARVELGATRVSLYMVSTWPVGGEFYRKFGFTEKVVEGFRSNGPNAGPKRPRDPLLYFYIDFEDKVQSEVERGKAPKSE